jgi:hypothetical protein
MSRVEHGGWTWTVKMQAQMRKIGDAWVVVEIPGEGERGLIVTVLSEDLK